MTLDLEPIKQRESKATKGPWVWSTDHPSACGDYMSIFADGQSEPVLHAAMWTNDSEAGTITAPTHEDAQFMCSARTDIPALVAEVGRLQSKIREAYEIYANSECPESSLRGEEYTLRILHEIVSVLGAALGPDAKDGTETRGNG